MEGELLHWKSSKYFLRNINGNSTPENYRQAQIQCQPQHGPLQRWLVVWSTTILCWASLQALEVQTQKDSLSTKHQVSSANEVHKHGTTVGTRCVVTEMKDIELKLTLKV